MKAENTCPVCGGRLLVEALGSYGDIYRLKKNGEMSKKRIKRRIYEGTTGEYLIYCEDCGREADPRDYGF